MSGTTFLADTGANAAAYSGLWYDQSKDGEGYNVISGIFTSVIFYYGSTSNGERLWLIYEGLSNDIDDGTTLNGKMYELTGGDFYHPAPSSTALKDWGTIEARFDDCKLASGKGEKLADFRWGTPPGEPKEDSRKLLRLRDWW